VSKKAVEHSWWQKLRLNWLTKRDLLSQISRLKEDATATDQQHQQSMKLLREENEHLREQLSLYRDTLQTYQVEKQLQGALAMADLKTLGSSG